MLSKVPVVELYFIVLWSVVRGSSAPASPVMAHVPRPTAPAPATSAPSLPPLGSLDNNCLAIVLTVVFPPAEDFNLEIGAGLGDHAGKVWRIGLMGYACKPRNIDHCLAALRTVLK